MRPKEKEKNVFILSSYKIIYFLLPNGLGDYLLLKPLKYGLPDHKRVVSNQQLKSNIFEKHVRLPIRKWSQVLGNLECVTSFPP